MRVWLLFFLMIDLAFGDLAFAGRTQRRNAGCLREELSWIEPQQRAGKRRQGGFDAQLEAERLAEQELEEVLGRSFREVAHSESDFLDQNVIQAQWRVAQATEKIGLTRDPDHPGLEDLRYFLTHTLELPGQFHYLGPSGTRVAFLWKQPDGKRQVVKIPRFQQLFDMGKAEQARMPLSQATYGEFLNVKAFADAIQSREDALMHILEKRGIAVAQGDGVASAQAELFEAVGGRVSPYVEGPDLNQVIAAYRSRMGNAILRPAGLPPLFKNILLFEGAIEGREVSGSLGEFYKAVRADIRAKIGDATYETNDLESYLLRGQSQRVRVIVDLNAGRNLKMDSRFWARDAQGQLIPQGACTGALLIWAAGYCIYLGLPQLPQFVDL